MTFTEALSPLGAVGVATGLGVLVGSFLNVCVHRWPEGQSVVRPPSHCPGCGAPVQPRDNIPVVSWVLLRGRCRACRTAISIRYPLVELAVGALWGGMVWHEGLEFEALRGAVFLTILLGIALTDARTYLIPNPFTLGGAALGLGMAFLPGGIEPFEALLGAGVGYGVLALVGWGATRVFRKPAMGGGDIKMMAMVGAFTGSTGVFLTLFLGSVLGAVLFAPWAWRSRTLVPFGVFLALGAAVTWIWGGAIVAAYLAWAFGAPA